MKLALIRDVLDVRLDEHGDARPAVRGAGGFEVAPRQAGSGAAAAAAKPRAGAS